MKLDIFYPIQYTIGILPMSIPTSLNYSAKATVIDNFFSIEFTVFLNSFCLYYSNDHYYIPIDIPHDTCEKR